MLFIPKRNTEGMVSMIKMSVKITEIEWDFDDETYQDIEGVNLHLPSVPFYVTVEAEDDDIDNLPVADAISDEYGWCVKNCEYDIETVLV
ncbi:MAG: hypothetical protein [Caudoviricetes sp.]|nr:MAG: hypothetical protein [Caudoviricetes sp.]